MTKSKVTILGGFGFIGSHLASHLVDLGYNVTLFGHSSRHLPLQFPATVTILHGDFSDIRELRQAIDGSETVFHLIGNSTPISSNQNLSKDVQDNLVPTLNLFEACVQAGVRQVVFASSGGTIYGVSKYLPIDENHPTEPICAYGVNKLTIEHYMRLFSRFRNIDMTAIRISNPYGPWQNITRGQGIVGTYCSDIASDKAIQVWGDGNVVRDYIYIRDVAEALELVIGNAPGFKVYNLSTGIGTTINDLVNILGELQGTPLNPKYLPGRDVDVLTNILDIRKFMSDFDWKPKISLRDGVALTLAWHKQRGSKTPDNN